MVNEDFRRNLHKLDGMIVSLYVGFLELSSLISAYKPRGTNRFKMEVEKIYTTFIVNKDTFKSSIVEKKRLRNTRFLYNVKVDHYTKKWG